MKKLIVSTATGAIVGAAVYKIIPCNDNKITNKIMKRSKKMKHKIMKKISIIIDNMM